MIVLVAIVPLPYALSDVSSNPQSLREQSLRYISESYGVPVENLVISNEANATFPLTGRNLWTAKILDINSMMAYGVYMDANGKIVDVEAIKAEEREEYANQYGKLERILRDHLQTVGSNELTDIMIWLTSTSTPVSKSISFTENDYDEFLKSKRQFYAIKQQPIVDFITTNAFQVIYASQYAPIIFAKLPKNLILELQNRSDVDMVFLSGVCEAELDTVVPTVRANAVWNEGIDGSGITVADVEAGGCIFQSPFHPLIRFYWLDDPQTSDHATAIAGIIGSTHATYRGLAHGVPTILDGNARDWTYAELIAATEWAITNGARVINYSWRDLDHQSLELGPLDRYADHIVWDDYVTMVKSAGNRGQFEGNVTSPGLGYNIITVGSIDDQNNEQWSDDVISGFSSWRDPISTHNDREKPELVAVGSADWPNVGVISSIDVPPWFDDVGSGTSYAAPNVVGGAALLMEAQPWVRYWPEAVKAVLMASAVHNVEGDCRLSEFDGAGAIDLWTAYETVISNRADRAVCYATDFPRSFTFNAAKGQRIRVAIAWDSHPDDAHPPTTDPLESDLDLIIRDPDGMTVTYSMSFDNSYEIVDFLALKDGTYTAQIDAYRFDGDYEYLSWAYCVSPVWTREWYDITYDGNTYTPTNYLGTTTVDNLYFADDWGGGTVAFGRNDHIGFSSFAPLYITSTTSFSVGITTDDGVRFWADDQLLLDKWFLQGVGRYSVDFTLGLIGTHNLRLDWFEWEGNAVIKFLENEHPLTPSTPSGPTSGYVNTLYSYNTSTTDPDGDDVRYLFDWGDNSQEWTTYYTSGATATLSHAWASPGTYQVKVLAQDIYGANSSSWSVPLEVVISKSSCPFVYVWDGTRFVMLADVLGPGGLAYPDVSLRYDFRPPNPHDFAVIPGEMLQAVDGKYVIELAEHANEIAYIDALRLIAVDHPIGYDLYSPTVMTQIPLPFEYRTAYDPISPVTATKHDYLWGQLVDTADVLDAVLTPDDLNYAVANINEWHMIELDFGDLGDLADISEFKLIINGWMIFTNDSIGDVLWIQQHPETARAPYIEVINEFGEWEAVGEPVCNESFWEGHGMPRTMMRDISQWLKTSDYRLRLHYWGGFQLDWIAADITNTPVEQTTFTILKPSTANLYYKGGVQFVSTEGDILGYYPALPDWDIPYTYDTELFVGYFTRYGNVKPLLKDSDDMFVIMNYGDSIHLEFPEVPVPEGMERDYYFFTDGYFKLPYVKYFLNNTVSTVDPLPFHDMTTYPYSEDESYPDDPVHQAYLRVWNTRYIGPEGGMADDGSTFRMGAASTEKNDQLNQMLANMILADQKTECSTAKVQT